MSDHAASVSVITAVLNRNEYLERHFESVQAQDYQPVEHVLVDGGSNDGSLACIERHLREGDVLVRGPDSGIAEAMNKGVAAASGDYLLFLHADDRFPSSQALLRAMRHVGSAESIWAFDIQFGEGDRASTTSPRPFNAWAWFKNPLPHQGVLCPRELFNRLGGFDTTLRIAMDYDFWLRAYRAGIPLRRIKQVLAVMGDGGVSSRRDWPGLATRFSEERLVQSRHASNKPWRWCYSVYWPTYLAYRRLRCRLSS